MGYEAYMSRAAAVECTDIVEYMSVTIAIELATLVMSVLGACGEVVVQVETAP